MERLSPAMRRLLGILADASREGIPAVEVFPTERRTADALVRRGLAEWASDWYELELRITADGASRVVRLAASPAGDSSRRTPG